MISDRILINRHRFFGPKIPKGSVPADVTGICREALPPFFLKNRLYLGFIAPSVQYGFYANSLTVSFSGSLGQPPTALTASIPGPVDVSRGPNYRFRSPCNGVWGLDRPLLRPAVVLGHAFSSASGVFDPSEGLTPNLVRLDGDGGDLPRYPAPGTRDELVTPPYALPAWNRVVFGQGAADEVVSFLIAPDGTAAFAARTPIPFGESPKGIGTVVASATRALVFGREIENRNQIAVTTDGATYTALPEAVISPGKPIKINDGLALPAEGGNPAVILALGVETGPAAARTDSGPIRLLRSADDGQTFTSTALNGLVSSIKETCLAYVNGTLFLFTAEGWGYSTDRGATWIEGTKQVVRPSRVDYDADLRIYVLHLRVGAIAILEADLTYKGTLAIPPNDQFAGFTAAAPNFICPSFYDRGAIYGLARSNGPLVSYRYDLPVLRVPWEYPARVRLKGGGGAGMAYAGAAYSGWTSAYAGMKPLGSLSPAGVTIAHGIGAAAGGASEPAPNPSEEKEREFLYIPSFKDLHGALKASGMRGEDYAGNIVGKGGDISFLPAEQPCFLLGGGGGRSWEGWVEPGTLLLFTLGAGARTFCNNIPVSIGGDGGALVEYQEYV